MNSKTSSLIQFKYFLHKTQFNNVLLMLSMLLCFSLILTTIQIAQFYHVKSQETLNHVHAVIFLDSLSNTDNTAAIKAKLSQLKSIQTVTLINKEDGVTYLKNEPRLSEALSHLKHNPLPDAFLITFKATNQEDIPRLIKQWQQMEHVQKIDIDLPWIDRTLHSQHVIATLIALLIAVFSMVFLVLSVNSIRHYFLTSEMERFVVFCLGSTPWQTLKPILMVVMIETLLVTGLGSLVSILTLRYLNLGLASLFLPANALSTLSLLNYHVIFIALVVSLALNAVLTLAINLANQINPLKLKQFH